MRFYYVFLSFIFINIPLNYSLGNPLFKKAQHLFCSPQPVPILHLPKGSHGTPISTEEPFISRDGRFLFFNSSKEENNKDLHFAQKIAGQWIYQKPLGPSINTRKDVQANPTMDAQGNFLYMDSSSKYMIRIGKFNPSTQRLLSLHDFLGVPPRQVSLAHWQVKGNMGVEISKNGEYLFFSRATWRLKLGISGFSVGKLLQSDLLFSQKIKGQYRYIPQKSAWMMKNINTNDFEYAASISSDGLELFFTRLKLKDYRAGRIRTRIMRAFRKAVTQPFQKPKMIRAIGDKDFVEGPAISDDGKELYYHKRVGRKFRIYKVRRCSK